MKKDFNQSEKICFDNLSNEPKSEEVIQSAIIQEHIEQELNKLPVDEKKKILTELYQHASLDANEVSTDNPENKKKVHEQKKLTFDWSKSPELLTLLMYEIQDKLHVFAHRSSVAVFVRMATCNDLSQFNEKIFLRGKTKLFSYIRERLEPYFSGFTPTNIERSGLFISKKGNLVKANCLYNSSTVKPQVEKILDNILKKML